MSNAPSQIDLVRRARRGDGEAFSQLTRPVHRKLFETAWFLTGERDEADDLAQETLVRAYLSFPGFREEAPLLPWLLTILKNLFVDSRRSGRRRYEVAERDFRPHGAAEDPSLDEIATQWGTARGDALEGLLRKERIDDLRRQVAALPPEFALAVVLVDVQELSYAEAAEAMGVPINTVRTRLFRGRTLLRSRMLASAGEPGATGGSAGSRASPIPGTREEEGS